MNPFRDRQPVTLITHLGIEMVEVTKERVVARMPVNEKVHQPWGILHGGASVTLAETVASTGAWMNVDQEKEQAVGIEINANHVRAKSDGVVTATGVPISAGRRIQVWEVTIVDEAGKTVCISRCTLAVVPAKG